jgi:hypothetical protein
MSRSKATDRGTHAVKRDLHKKGSHAYHENTTSHKHSSIGIIPDQQLQDAQHTTKQPTLPSSRRDYTQPSIMENDPMFNLAFGNGRLIEGAATVPDINVLDAQYRQEQHEQSEFQRFLRQHNHNTTVEDLGLAGYDPALEDKYHPLVPQLEAAEPIEERPEVLRHASTVRNGGFRRYSTPPTTPELPAVHPVGLGQNHNILPPHPDLMLTSHHGRATLKAARPHLVQP